MVVQQTPKEVGGFLPITLFCSLTHSKKDLGIVLGQFAYQPIKLTSAGARMASKSQKRHEVVLQFLRKLGVSERAATIDSEGIEHHVGKETLAAMRKAIEKGWPKEPQ